MTKFVARVTRVLVPGIHRLATIVDGEIHPIADMSPPTRVEIELDGGRDEPCMMYRYTDAEEFCGDTWHACLDDALSQAAYEYGLSETDFTEHAESP